MSEETVDIPGRARRVRKISGALTSIPASETEVTRLLRNVSGLSEESFQALSDRRKLQLLRDLRRQLLEQRQRYQSLLKISNALGASFNRREFLQMTMEHIPDVMEADRATLYLVHAPTGELRGTIAQKADTEIVLSPGEGIAGWVAETGRSLNIRDAYKDSRFQSQFDRQTGYQTRSMLCQPLRNSEGKVIGVIQVLNSDNPHFSEDDENLLSAIGGQIAIALENSDLYHSLVEKNSQLTETTQRLEQKIGELDLLYDIQRQLSQPSDLDGLVETITRKTLDLVDGKACALTLRDDNVHRVNVLIDRSAGEERRWEFYTRTLEPEDTPAHQVLESGDPFVCQEGSCLAVPGPTHDDEGMDVDNLIAVPLVDDDTCIGALQVFNLTLSKPPHRLGFTNDDVKLLSLIASQIASTVASRRRREVREKEDRLSTIGQMIAGILHDFKTPFSVISGYVQLMADNDDPEQRKEYADRVLQQFKELDQMTRELLKFARGDSQILLRKVLVHKFMEEVGELLKTELQSHDIDFNLEVTYRGEAHLDPVKMKRAILNLARNAAEAMPDGGTVVVRVEKHNQSLRLIFRDTGHGIPPEIRGNLFNSFVTKGKDEGTGLGLAVVKKIVDEHQGSIDFETELGEGTTFYIDLPLSPPDESK